MPWGFTPAPQLLQGIYKRPIGRFWASDGFQLLHMDFQLGLGKTIMFWRITPTHSTPYFNCCTFCWFSYGNARGGDVTIGQVHPW